MKIQLGVRAKDKVTGFEGLVIGKASYITGCDQYLLQPAVEAGKADKKPEGHWFDEQRLEVTTPRLWCSTRPRTPARTSRPRSSRRAR